MANQCVMCGIEMPEGGHVCVKCMNGVIQSNHLIGSIKFPKSNTELPFGADNKNYDFIANYCRAKPLNRFQIWMHKICFGICIRNI